MIKTCRHLALSVAPSPALHQMPSNNQREEGKENKAKEKTKESKKRRANVHRWLEGYGCLRWGRFRRRVERRDKQGGEREPQLFLLALLLRCNVVAHRVVFVIILVIVTIRVNQILLWWQSDWRWRRRR